MSGLKRAAVYVWLHRCARLLSCPPVYVPRVLFFALRVRRVERKVAGTIARRENIVYVYVFSRRLNRDRRSQLI